MENLDNPGETKHIFLDRKDGRFALYINGDLQFDAEDERLYHEPLAWLPTALAVKRNSDLESLPVRVLILGGGDGLALREVLRFPEVTEIHLVEHDPEILRLGKSELAQINQNAFDDKRVQVHEMDARDYRPENLIFDVIIFDLTYPKDVATASLFSVSFIEFMKQHLNTNGILAMNAVSPTKTPKGFGCIARTLNATQLSPLPYSCEIPSFARSGFGRWGFFLASQQVVKTGEFLNLSFPSNSKISVKDDSFQIPIQFMEHFKAAANQTHELLFYLGNDTPISWIGPFGSMNLDPTAVLPAPKFSTSQYFAHWLQTPDGRLSIENLLSVIPQSAREHTRQALLDWSTHAGASLSAATFSTFVSRLFDRVDKLPPEWAKEVYETRKAQQGAQITGVESQKPPRLLAMFMIMLLYANFFFKDNLYAKGTGFFQNPDDNY